jgi:hypothetical protein
MTPEQIRHAKSLAVIKAPEFETPSQLAEFIALSLDMDDELDDETSEIWQLAFEAFVTTGNLR